MNPFYLSYRYTSFFRTVKNLGIFGGDVIRNDGTSGVPGNEEHYDPQWV
jgi:hypothetical protein